MTRQCSQGRPGPVVHHFPVVHPSLKHTDDVHNPSAIEGNRSQDCIMELFRDALQNPDVEFVCEKLGPVTGTLNQRLPVKQTVVTQTDSTCGMKDSDTAGRPTAVARQRDEGHLSDDVVKITQTLHTILFREQQGFTEDTPKCYTGPANGECQSLIEDGRNGMLKIVIWMLRI